MTLAIRLTLTLAAGIAAVIVVVLLRTAAGADPVVSHGLTGPGFLGAVAALVTWVAISRKKLRD